MSRALSPLRYGLGTWRVRDSPSRLRPVLLRTAEARASPPVREERCRQPIKDNINRAFGPLLVSREQVGQHLRKLFFIVFSIFMSVFFCFLLGLRAPLPTKRVTRRHTHGTETYVLCGGPTLLRHTRGKKTQVLRSGLGVTRRAHGVRTIVLRGGFNYIVCGMGQLAGAGLAFIEGQENARYTKVYKIIPRSPAGLGRPNWDGLAAINDRDKTRTHEPEERKNSSAGEVVHDELPKRRRPVAGT